MATGMNLQTICKISAALVLFLILVTTQALALNTGPEQQTGTVSGKVYKPFFLACAGAKVELDLGDDKKITAQTDEKGIYLLANVPVGANYTITASKDGYKPAIASAVNVSAGKTTTVNLLLKK
jgi:hypothetical protein